jgi:lipoprotein-anchoring transpeptidase ErfK/SrfK
MKSGSAIFALAILLSLSQANSIAARRNQRAHAPRDNSRPAAQMLYAAAVNLAQTDQLVCTKASGSAVVRIQILLDRAHFSPGEIDGHYGDNLRVALVGYQTSRKLSVNGTGDSDTWKSLNADTEPMLVPYVITPDDVNGPFDQVPDDMMEKAKLKSLGYESTQEELGERFHINPKLLEQLNPGKTLTQAGEEILVPNDQHVGSPEADRVIVSKKNRTVTALALDGTILMQYPATIGSEHDPLPIGDLKVTVIQQNPRFNFNPALFWDANSKDAKARVAPGPDNPVGVVWIGLSKEHYGIHGTPEPANIGHSESHGCIRLTNWDARELSAMVKPGTPAILQE